MFSDPLEAGAELLRGQESPFPAGVVAVEHCVVLQAGEEFRVVAAMVVVGYAITA